MLSLRRWLPSLGRRVAWEPLDFDKAATSFPAIPSTERIDEETIPDYVASRYYPARIGEVLGGRYQIVGKLGFGASSTAWLARDLSHCRHVALKLFINSQSMGSYLDNELNIYRRINAGPKSHPGYSAVRTLVDSFHVDGPDGKHQCLVHPPLLESVLTYLHRNPVKRLPAPDVAFILKRLFLALDFLHTECQVIHTDIKAANIMYSIDDETVFTDFEQLELIDPCPRKEVASDGRTIYMSRELRMPKYMGPPVLCDFGSAVVGNTEHTEDVQPDIYRAPEVILEAVWSYNIDIWNVACMIWDIFEGGHLFTGEGPEQNTYDSAVHISQIMSLLGEPPRHLLAQGKLARQFFSDSGTFLGPNPPQGVSLTELKTNLEGNDKRQFLEFMQKMLQWKASDRSSAKDLVQDKWIRANLVV